jgi:hypothetical protein
MTMRLQELHELTRALVGKAEDDSVLHAVLSGVLGDPPQNGESALDGGVDRHEVAGLQVRQDSLPGRRQRYEMPSDVPIDAQRQVEKWMRPGARDRSPANIVCSRDASEANRSDRSRTISTIRATTTSDGSAANIFGRVGWTCTRPNPASFSIAR